MIVKRRSTKYTAEVRRIIASFGHATNAQIASKLREDYPAVSDTTVHRVTQRLHADGDIGVAPSSLTGCMRYDVTTEQHDHFECLECDNLRDIHVPDAARELIQAELGMCKLNGPLTVTGGCGNCVDEQGATAATVCH